MRNIELERAIERAGNFFGSWLFSVEIDAPLYVEAKDMASGDGRDYVKRLLGYIALCIELRKRRRLVERAALRELDALYDELQQHVPSLGLESFQAPRTKIDYTLNSAHDLGDWAFTFLQTAYSHGKPSPVAALAMEAAYSVSSHADDIEYDDPRAFQERVSILMTIDAALRDPEAIIRGLRWVREQLVAADPALERK